MKKFLMFGAFAVLLSFGVAFLAGCGAPVNVKYVIDNRSWCKDGPVVPGPQVVNFILDSNGNRIPSPLKGTSGFIWPANASKYYFDPSKPAEYSNCYNTATKKYFNVTSSTPA